MKGRFVSSILILLLALTGCLNPSKTVHVIDSKGESMKQCMVLAVESNMLYPNKIGIFYTDDKGQVQIPYHGQVLYYAGKEQYQISTVGSAKQQVNIILYNKNQALPDYTVVSENIGIPSHILSEAALTPLEVKYYSSNSIIILPPKGEWMNE